MAATGGDKNPTLLGGVPSAILARWEDQEVAPGGALGEEAGWAPS